MSAVDVPVNPFHKLNATRPLIWTLVAITFLATFIFGLWLNKPNSTPTAEPEQSAIAISEIPVVEGTLNGKATVIPNAEFPEKARQEGASGKVRVAVQVDEKGNVLEARALDGHPLLQVPAVEAAKKAKFTVPKTRRSRTSGTIIYNFKR